MKYAIVKVLDEGELSKLVADADSTPYWDEFRPRYVIHSKTYKTASSVYTERSTLQLFTDFAKNPRIGSVTADFADRWKGLLLGRYSNNYVRSCLAAMRSAFDYAVEIKILSVNPFRSVRFPDLVMRGRVLTNDEIKIFLFNMPLIARRMCILALCTGMRRNEVANLKRKEWHDDHIVLPKEKTKSGKERIVWVDPLARKLMGPLPVDPEANIFPYGYRYLNDHVTEAWRRSGLGQIRFHDLRHTYATRVYKATKDLPWLMAQCGWASVRSAMPYQHGTNEDPGNLRLGYQF